MILLLIGVAIISLSLYPWQNKNTLEEIEFTILDNHIVEFNTDAYIITRISWTKNKYNYVAVYLMLHIVANVSVHASSFPSLSYAEAITARAGYIIALGFKLTFFDIFHQNLTIYILIFFIKFTRLT